ncbi:MAG: exodeoxyribonuclease V subunit alpha [Betaproteobacteria bacterium]|nr:exodeoxyribonuclease V subunit alpha [Betaproteobacteria bacterium]
MSLPDTYRGSPGGAFAHAFAAQCRRWANARGKDAAWQAGYRLALAEQEGKTCIELTAAETLALSLSGLLATEDDSGKPLILDQSGRLYLARYFSAEKELAASLAARNRALPLASQSAARAMLAQLFPNAEHEAQRQAVTLALSRQLVILSGGPGTGKTHSIARLLACLLAETPGLRIALAAPTGKAAARMQESLAQAAATLPPAIRALLPTETFTLHRLLGISADGLSPRYHSDHPLPFDLFVVDEASMLDLILAQQLCAALPATARLILLGDKAQLPAVEAGHVFAALTEAEALREAVLQLAKSYRFSPDSPLDSLIAALSAGDNEAAEAAFATSGDDLHWLKETGTTLSPPALQTLADGFAAWQSAFAAWRPGASPMPLFAALNEFRVLAVLREGERGAFAINAHLNRLFAPRHNVFRHNIFRHHAENLYPGQAIMIIRNDPNTRLYNGDTGILLPQSDNASRLKACFPDPENGGWRYLDISRLPEFESAFALTAHKAQGSEFTRVALVLPGQDTPLLTRELIYTALTRAKKRALLLGDSRLLTIALGRTMQHARALSERIRQACAEA